MCFWVLKLRVFSVPGGSILCIFPFRKTPFLFHNLPGVCRVVGSQVFRVAPWFGPDGSSLIASSLESPGQGRGGREKQYFQWLWILFCSSRLSASTSGSRAVPLQALAGYTIWRRPWSSKFLNQAFFSHLCVLEL